MIVYVDVAVRAAVAVRAVAGCSSKYRRPTPVGIADRCTKAWTARWGKLVRSQGAHPVPKQLLRTQQRSWRRLLCPRRSQPPPWITAIHPTIHIIVRVVARVNWRDRRDWCYGSRLATDVTHHTL